jgi:hypothetical protein
VVKAPESAEEDPENAEEEKKQRTVNRKKNKPAKEADQPAKDADQPAKAEKVEEVYTVEREYYIDIQNSHRAIASGQLYNGPAKWEEVDIKIINKVQILGTQFLEEKNLDSSDSENHVDLDSSELKNRAKLVPSDLKNQVDLVSIRNVALFALDEVNTFLHLDNMVMMAGTHSTFFMCINTYARQFSTLESYLPSKEYSGTLKMPAKYEQGVTKWQLSTMSWPVDDLRRIFDMDVDDELDRDLKSSREMFHPLGPKQMYLDNVEFVDNHKFGRNHFDHIPEVLFC